MCQAHDEGAGQSEALRFVGVSDIPYQGRPPFPRGIVPNSRNLSGSPECDRNEANAEVEEEREWRGEGERLELVLLQLRVEHGEGDAQDPSSSLFIPLIPLQAQL